MLHRAGIGRNLVAHAAEQLVERRVQALRIQVPERDVDRADGELRGVEQAVAAPHVLPDRLAVGRVLADEQRPQPVGDGVREAQPAVGADDLAGEALVGGDLHRQEIGHVGTDGLAAVESRRGEVGRHRWSE